MLQSYVVHFKNQIVHSDVVPPYKIRFRWLHNNLWCKCIYDALNKGNYIKSVIMAISCLSVLNEGRHWRATIISASWYTLPFNSYIILYTGPNRSQPQTDTLNMTIYALRRWNRKLWFHGWKYPTPVLIFRCSIRTDRIQTERNGSWSWFRADFKPNFINGYMTSSV